MVKHINYLTGHVTSEYYILTLPFLQSLLISGVTLIDFLHEERCPVINGSTATTTDNAD